MTDLSPTTAAQRANELQNGAREHKRAEFQHRRRARELMEELNQLRIECEARGIRLVIQTKP